MKKKIQALQRKGVRIPAPDSVEIGNEVPLERISGDGVVIHAGCKIYGSETLVLDGAKLGYEGPVTVENCCIGPDVQLKAGFFKEAVFLQKVIMGFGAHVREGCILEEESNAAHTVALKQTILFPFVTLGSLINFCDCLMAGGTSRRNHSEVGSSYIHFNYTPNQDKATPSLIGDVPRGVMLNQRPIFLGGQGGLVGPSRLAFGTLIAAGSIYRKDELIPDRLVFEGTPKAGRVPFHPGLYRTVKRTFLNNVEYISNLMALMQWYRNVRRQFISPDFPQPLYDGLVRNLDRAIAERIGRLGDFCHKMEASAHIYRRVANPDPSSLLLTQKQELAERWPAIEDVLKRGAGRGGGSDLRDRFLERLQGSIDAAGRDYIAAVQSLSREQSSLGTAWLQGIAERIRDAVFAIVPSLAQRTK